MRKTILNILIVIMSLFALTNCDVHEFPVDRHALVPFTLHLDFDTEMYFYKEIPYTRGDNEETKALATKHDVRYVINAYRTDNIVGVSHTPDTTFVFTKSDLTNLNYTANFEIREGTYRFAVWCDFVDEGSTADKYYNTSDFLEVILKDRDNHPGSNDFRDTFKGYATAKVIDPQYYIGSALTSIDNSATAQMTRPMGKVQFISTDVKEFISRMASLMQQQGLLSVSPDEDLYDAFLQSVDLGQFKVIINYDINMPCSYDMVYDKPSGIWENMSFVSRMNRISESEMILGFDYVFMDEFGTTLNFSVEVYDRNDKLMSRSNSVQVPIMPSKLTVVKGEFLTSIAEGGITIKPGYDGEWNWDITDVIQ